MLVVDHFLPLRSVARGPGAVAIRERLAADVALAEALDAVLLPTDDRLAGATGPTCRIDALTRS